jgi:hypothetical protein
MEVEPFDDRLITNQSPHGEQGSSGMPANEGQRKAPAAADLPRNKMLNHSFGEHEEYEIRATLMTRQAWSYRDCGRRHRRVFKMAFPPLEVDRTRGMQLRSTMPSAGARQRRDGNVQPQSSPRTPPGSPSPDTSHENDRRLQILRGKSCEPERYRGDSR